MLTIDQSDPTPLYAQLDRGIRAEIAAGRLRTGERLPTVRRLAVDLGINPNTVAKVYAELERAGVVATQRGVGTFVRDSPPSSLPAVRRDRGLRPLVDRLVADASAIGISLTEVVQYVNRLETRATGGGLSDPHSVPRTVPAVSSAKSDAPHIRSEPPLRHPASRLRTTDSND